MASARSSGQRIGSRTSGRQIRQKEKNVRTGARDYYDYNLLAAVILLTSFGLVMLYSTSAYSSLINNQTDMFYFRKQALISGAALIGIVIGSRIDYHLYVPFSGILYFFSMILLIITKVAGNSSHGATRWLSIGPISFQPAEAAKLAVILFLPWLIVALGDRIRTLKGFSIVFGAGMGAAVFTFYFTENLSTALIIAGITVIILFVVFPDTKKFFIGSGIIAAVGALALFIMVSRASEKSSFRVQRIVAWLSPDKHTSEGGYQVTQALYAIGSGGIFGKGLGNSIQKLGALPEAHNDMIFSIICEELGLFGAIIVVGLFVFMLIRLFAIAQNAPDLLGSLIAVGIFSHIAIQVVLNIAVVIRLLPTTGITLPFISYGGTSIVFLMSEMMVALSISNQIRR